MEERVHDSILIEAGVSECLSVVLDLESYPQWARDVREVKVLERDAEGRPLIAWFRVAAFGRSASYTLAYDHSKEPESVSWRQVDGDITTKLDGRYDFIKEGDSKTRVRYELEVGLRVPLPGFIKRRAETYIVRTALDELKKRVESLSREVKSR